MDLCAWQTGRAIQAGQTTFERLLIDPDPLVAAAAAMLLLIWPETRDAGKQTLIRLIENESNPVEQGRMILEFGVYAVFEDVSLFQKWVAQPTEVCAAAALAWAWIINPEPLPQPAARALYDTSVANADTFARLPWVGLWHRGPWILPANAADLILRLAENKNNELRWRAVQGLEPQRVTARHLSATQIIPLLFKRLRDRNPNVRDTAAMALSQWRDQVLGMELDIVPALISTLDDSSPSACGHAAALLVALMYRLSPSQREEALGGIERAASRFSGQTNSYVWFRSMAVQVESFLQQQHDYLLNPMQWNIDELFAEIAFPARENRRLTLAECDHRLADAYDQHPQQTIAVAIEAVRNFHNRDAAIGATCWLQTLGPVAKPALPTLEAAGEGDVDEYFRKHAQSACQFIRRSLLVEPDMDREATLSASNRPTRLRLALLAEMISKDRASPLDSTALVSELIDGLAHPDAYVRARSAVLIAQLPLSQVTDSFPLLERLLTDEEAAAVGVVGRVELHGRLYHWHQQWWSPRVSAIRALYQFGKAPEGEQLLRAMVAESKRPGMICSSYTAPHQFSIAQWQQAVTLAGGLAVGDPIICSARQQCLNQRYSKDDVDNSASAAEAELAEVIRQLSGRLL
jgi:hypothetical protein